MEFVYSDELFSVINNADAEVRENIHTRIEAKIQEIYTGVETMGALVYFKGQAKTYQELLDKVREGSVETHELDMNVHLSAMRTYAFRIGLKVPSASGKHVRDYKLSASRLN